MTQAKERRDFELNHILNPSAAFRTPQDVVNDPHLTIQEKRATLASWASDACAVEAAPDLRQPGANAVPFDDIMEALKCLDGPAASTPQYSKFISRAQRLKALYRSDGRYRPPFAAEVRP